MSTSNPPSNLSPTQAREALRAAAEQGRIQAEALASLRALLAEFGRLNYRLHQQHVAETRALQRQVETLTRQVRRLAQARA